MKTARILYLPIEIQARELVGKALLASKAVERGWQVVLGKMGSDHMAPNNRTPGVFMENSLNGGKRKRLRQCRSQHQVTTNLCEEAVVYYDGYDYCRRKVDAAALEQVDLMLVTGARNARHLRQFRPESEAKMAVTGNPRFDTLMPGCRQVYQAEADQIRKQFGRFLLINTNFSLTNHLRYSAEEMLERFQKAEGDGQRGDNAELLKRWFAYKAAQFDRFRPFVEELARSKAFDNIILRPHPSENQDVWSSFGQPLGLQTIYSGSANSWMLAADAILHTGCTTGIEGVLLDRQVASFVFEEAESDMANQADQVSLQVKNAEEFLTQVCEWQNLDPDEIRARIEPQHEVLSDLIANVGPPMAVDRILDSLDAFDVPEMPVPAFANRRASKQLRKLFGHNKTPSRLDKQKIPGFDDAVILSLAGTWAEAGALDRVPSVEAGSDGAWVLH